MEPQDLLDLLEQLGQAVALLVLLGLLALKAQSGRVVELPEPRAQLALLVVLRVLVETLFSGKTIRM
jgi:hypothetical protein